MPGPLVAASGDLDAWASFMLVEFTAYDTSHARQGTVLDNLSDNAGTVSFLALSDEHLMPGCRQSEHGPDVDFHTDKFRQQKGALQIRVLWRHWRTFSCRGKEWGQWAQGPRQLRRDDSILKGYANLRRDDAVSPTKRRFFDLRRGHFAFLGRPYDSDLHINPLLRRMVLDVLFDFALTCMEATTKNGSSLRAVLHKPECEGHQQLIFPVADPGHNDVFFSEPIGANAVKCLPGAATPSVAAPQEDVVGHGPGPSPAFRWLWKDVLSYKRIDKNILEVTACLAQIRIRQESPRARP